MSDERQSMRAHDSAARAMGHNSPSEGDSSRASAAVLIWNDVADEGRSAFYRWHNGEHMPERMSIPGFVRGRRYASPGNCPEWFTLYEAESMDVLVSRDYLDRLNNPTAATQETLLHFRNTSRSVCQLWRASGSAIGGHTMVMRFDQVEPALDLRRTRDALVSLLEQMEATPGVLGTRLYGADLLASGIETAESRTRPADAPLLTMLADACHRSAVEELRNSLASRTWSSLGIAPRRENCLYQLEVCFC